MKNLFLSEGTWYKGNLHMHTTISDGRLSPEEAIRLYQKAEYNFIALTDHWKESDCGERNGMLLLNGCEYNVGDMFKSPVYHIVGVGMEEKLNLHRNYNIHPQEIIDKISKAGGLAILAHPAWSVTPPEECMELNGLCGAEIYNTFSGLPWNARPDSSVFFDTWAAKGKLASCMAADDCHCYEGEQTKSYIMVKARELTKSSIKKAIWEGNFYASQGPKFLSIQYDSDKVRINCSKAATVIFYSNTVWCKDRVATGEVESAEYEIKPTDRYVRVELIDSEGRRAWCSPFAVNCEG